jgi:acetyl-CoA synthetase
VLRAVVLDRDPGDITTIEDEGSVDEARQAWQQMRDTITSWRSAVRKESPP